jgi:hypothetical protein
LGSRALWVDDSSSDSPSPDDDDVASDLDGVPAPRADGGGVALPLADGDGTVGNGVDTGGVGTGGAMFNPPTVAVGVVTVAIGVVTVGVGVLTVTVGVVTPPVGFFRLGRLCHFAFHPASACRSRPSNPLGTAIVLGTLGPFNPFEASEDSAVAL